MRVRIRIMAVVVAAAVIGVSVPADAASRTGVWAVGHVQNVGWQDSSNVEIGTTGRSLRLEVVRLWTEGDEPATDALSTFTLGALIDGATANSNNIQYLHPTVGDN